MRPKTLLITFAIWLAVTLFFSASVRATDARDRLPGPSTSRPTSLDDPFTGQNRVRSVSGTM